MRSCLMKMKQTKGRAAPGMRFFMSQQKIKQWHRKDSIKQVCEEMIFAPVPEANETKKAFIDGVSQKVLSEVINKKYINHMLIMSYDTRLARQDETLKNASNKMDVRMMEKIELPFVERILLTGHTLSTLLCEKNIENKDHTMSFRPDLSKILRKLKPVPDERLSQVFQKECRTYPVKHTSVVEEVRQWASDAFYVFHTQPRRAHYPLHCLFFSMNQEEMKTYCIAANEIKQYEKEYRLLDCFHPFTADAYGSIVPALNCTAVIKLVEKIKEKNLCAALGNNPTPQWVREVINTTFFHVKKEQNKSETLDLFNMMYKHKM